MAVAGGLLDLHLSGLLPAGLRRRLGLWRPHHDMADCLGKVFIVTGGATGVGFQVGEQVAAVLVGAVLVGAGFWTAGVVRAGCGRSSAVLGLGLRARACGCLGDPGETTHGLLSSAASSSAVRELLHCGPCATCGWPGTPSEAHPSAACFLEWAGPAGAAPHVPACPPTSHLFPCTLSHPPCSHDYHLCAQSHTTTAASASAFSSR